MFAGGLRSLKIGGVRGSIQECLIRAARSGFGKELRNRLWLWFSEPSVAAPLLPGGAVHVFHVCERAGWL